MNLTSTIDLLNDIAEFLEPQMDADGGPDGYKPNAAMTLHIQVEQQIAWLKRKSESNG